MLECVAALLGGFHHHLQALNGFILPSKFLKKRRAKGNLKCGIQRFEFLRFGIRHAHRSFETFIGISNINHFKLRIEG
jgi:hypothetical protein